MDYRYGSHTVYKIEYHFVWVTKYRYQVLSIPIPRPTFARSLNDGSLTRIWTFSPLD